MKYFIVCEYDCFYVVIEEDYIGSGNDIVATCDTAEYAELVSTSLAEHYKNLLQKNIDLPH
jgi:hypothetical protein